jgi:uncharacterized membrane-anchored protein YhcB (DUF1043 family)
MTVMDKKMQWLVLGVAVVLSVWTGHRLGAADQRELQARLGSTQRQLAALRSSTAPSSASTAAGLAKSVSLDTQSAGPHGIAAALEAQRQSCEARIQELRQSFEEQQAELNDMLDESHSRLASLSGKQRHQEAPRDASAQGVREGMMLVSREEWRRREQELSTLRQQGRRVKASANCLSSPVPHDALSTLSQVALTR